VPQNSFRLRTEPDYARYWTGQSVSLIGSQVTAMALPLTAILYLRTNSVGTGILFFCQFLPALLGGVHMGMFVDRFSKRSLLVICDLTRAALLTGVVTLVIAHMLTMAELVAAGFLLGTSEALGEICGQAFVPLLVSDDHLEAANTKLQKVATFAEVSGNSMAGLLIQVLTAPFALLIDAASSVFSAIALARVRQSGAGVAGGGERPLKGLVFILGHARLRAITLCGTTSNFFASMMVALYLLFVTRSLGFSPGMIGVLLTVASGLALLAAEAAAKLMSRTGLGGTLINSQLVMAIGCMILPLTTGPFAFKSVMLVLSHGVFMIGMITFSVAQLTYRQQVTPPAMQGRVHAGSYAFTYGGYALGALAGGGLGVWIGLRETLVIGALGHLLAAVWILPRRWRQAAPASAPKMESNVHS
jgi:MFS family permease